MKYIILCALIVLSGCVNHLGMMSSNMSKIEIGMTEAQVISTIGKPTSVSARDGMKIYNYKLYTTTSSAVLDGRSDDFYVIFGTGSVVAYGGVQELRALSK